MNAFTTWLFARLGEASTWAGISGAVAGMTFLPAADLSVTVKVIAMFSTVIPGVIAIVKADTQPQSKQ